jgi:hypothetical protein
MEELISLYLFKNRKCPLPEIGTLHLTESNAVAWYADKRIEAPQPGIKLNETVANPDDLISFIAQRKKMNNEDAANSLRQFCRQLYSMDAFGETKLPNTGKFFVNSEGNLVFKALELPVAFRPQVSAERVIHPVASHEMMVGDKHTTTTEMAAYYTESGSAKSSKWWVWALALALIGSGTLAWYIYNEGYSGLFGKVKKIETAIPASTYQMAE